MKLLSIAILFLLLPLTAFTEPPFADPLTLEQCIEQAYQHNPQLQASRESLEMSDAQVAEARAGMFPTVTVNGTYVYFGKIPTTVLDFGDMPFPFGADPTKPADPAAAGGSEPIEIEMGATHNWTGEVNVQQPLFTFGKLWNAYKQAVASREAARVGYEAAKQQLRLQVTEAFYTLLLAQEYLTVAEQAVELVEAQVKVTRQMLDAGIATEFEMLRAQVQLANIQSQRVRAKNGLELARNALKMTSGIDMREELEVKGEFSYEPQEFELPELIETALAQRPDLLQLQWRANAGQKLVRLAQAGYLPNLSLAGNYRVNDTEDQDRNTSWNIAVALSIPIFNGFSTRAKVRQAESGLRQIEWAQEQLRDAIELDVRTSYLQLQETEALVDVQRQSVEQAKEGLRLAQLRYENGMLTSVELIDSQLALTQARVNRLQALHDYLVGLARLRKAIGAG